MNNSSEIRFWLNDQEVIYHGLPNLTLLDFLRYDQDLRGTKIGCREGDCGACTVMLGRLENGKIRYRQIVSCLTPMKNVIGGHVVTIEGINRKDGLTIPQKLIVKNGGTQCGFCTVGFIVSMTAFCINATDYRDDLAIKAVDGNICRCTGYHSIIRSLKSLVKELKPLTSLSWHDRIVALADKRFLPNYFPIVVETILKNQRELREHWEPVPLVIGGGTDLFVQRRHTLLEDNQETFYSLPMKKEEIQTLEDFVVIPANATVSDLEESQPFLELVPNFSLIAKLISSTPIRNLATIAGNFVNASPIGDLSILFLTMETFLIIQGKEQRQVNLRDFFKEYRVVDLKKGEIITAINVKKLNSMKTNFEKVSKRTHLDIASVNSALSIVVGANRLISYAGVALGGVAPIPLYLKKTSNYLIGRPVDSTTIKEALRILDMEISPIDDVRGSASYNRLLSKSLFIRHFLELGFISAEMAIGLMNEINSIGGNGNA